MLKSENSWDQNFFDQVMTNFVKDDIMILAEVQGTIPLLFMELC